jgi:hypothetical protein
MIGDFKVFGKLRVGYTFVFYLDRIVVIVLGY